MLIKSAGFMWHRQYIDWTRRLLIGVSEDGGREEYNFADQSGIYGLYDDAGQCVYVGQAGKGDQVCLYDRLRDHALKDHLFCFWQRFTWFGFYSAEQLLKGEYPDPIASAVHLDEALNVIESVCIYMTLPRFNRRYGSGFTGVAWYYQSAEYEKAKNTM